MSYLSQVSKRKSALSRSNVKSSISSVVVQKLQRELQEERTAREKIEKEIFEIKRLNSELSTTLGMLTK